jgi:hypothetical protein
MVGAALLTSCHVQNRVPLKNKEKSPYKEWIGKKLSLSYLCTVDCVFLGYAHHSIAYRCLVIKLEVPDVHVDTFFSVVMLLSLKIFSYEKFVWHV